MVTAGVPRGDVYVLAPDSEESVSATVGNSQVGDQLAVSRRECSRCGAPLVHAVEGHVDRGWRMDERVVDEG